MIEILLAEQDFSRLFEICLRPCTLLRLYYKYYVGEAEYVWFMCILSSHVTAYL
jgi:nitrate reductase beta subunit